MCSVEAYLNLLNFSTQLLDVRKLLDKAKVKTTFWGGRILEIDGFTSSISLNEITRKILEAATERPNQSVLTKKEKLAGLEIVQKLRNFYKDTDFELKKANFFTRFFVWIRESSSYTYTLRFYIETLAEGQFQSDSKINRKNLSISGFIIGLLTFGYLVLPKFSKLTLNHTYSKKIPTEDSLEWILLATQCIGTKCPVGYLKDLSIQKLARNIYFAKLSMP